MKATLEKWTPLFSMLVLLLIWKVLATLAQSNLLPSPETVFQVLIREIQGGKLTFHLGMTLLRLIISFLIAMTLGSLIGILLGRSPRADRFFDSWVVISLNVPALVTIILCYVWLGLNEFAAITAVVLNKLPNVVVTLREGARHINRDLLEMAKVYRLSRIKTFRHVIGPELFPYGLTAARTGIALIWKIILVVELLGRSNGMGYQLHLYFQTFDVARILAYSMAFIVVVQMIEWMFIRPLDARARRWRR